MPPAYPNANHKIIAKQETNPGGVKKSVEASFWSAPLPSPDMMVEYEKVVKGSADRIIKRFEIQGDHRQKCEKVFVYTTSIKSLGGWSQDSSLL